MTQPANRRFVTEATVNTLVPVAVADTMSRVAAATGTSGAVTLNTATASVFTLTPTSAVTSVTLTNLHPGATTVTLVVQQGPTARTVGLGGTVKWLTQAPLLQANKTAVYTLFTPDGGTTVYASAVAEA